MIELVKQTFTEWSDDRAARLAAALSYYTVFSLAPFLIIVIWLAGFLYSRDAIQNRVLDQIGALIGSGGEDFIRSMLESSARSSLGGLAAIIGVVVLLIGALGIFGTIQDSLNTIWNVKVKPARGIKETIKRLLLSRLLSFAMVLVIGFLLLVSMVLTAVISALQQWVGTQAAILAPGLQAFNIIVSFLITALLFALMFKFLPDVIVSWRDVIIGGLVTSFLFNLGKFLLGLYLGSTRVGSVFGAAGSLAIILVWIYYSAQIVFLGAEFTQVYANQRGSKILPNEIAEPISVIDREKQGMKTV